MHNTRCAGRQKWCTIRTCLRLSGSLHQTSTSSHGGEATGSRNRELYPWTRHQAPVAQWIEQAPSKRLAAGSSPAGGAQPQPSPREGFLLVRMGVGPRRRAPDAPPVIAGRVRRCPAVTGFLRVAAVNTRRSSPGGRQPVSDSAEGPTRARITLDVPELSRDAQGSSDRAVTRRPARRPRRRRQRPAAPCPHGDE